MEEDGTDLAAELWQRAPLVASSVLCHPEARAALAAARRNERLAATQHRRTVRELDALCGELTIVGIDGALARRAGALAEARALRGFDAVHLATALSLGGDALVVTWDLELARAAHAEGLAVAPAIG